MEKKYVTPEVKVVEMEATPLMAASLNGTGESGTWKGMPATSSNDDEIGMPSLSSTEPDE